MRTLNVMNILFSHLSFPGQFKFVATSLAMSGMHDVRFLTTTPQLQIDGVKKILYTATDTAPMSQTEKALALGSSAYQSMMDELQLDGFSPDVIVAQAGYGPSLFLKRLFPDVPLIGYFEWFFDSAANVFHISNTRDEAFERAAKERNQLLLEDLKVCDFGICATEFQKSQFPPEFQDKLTVIHEGVKTSEFVPGVASPKSLKIGSDTLALDERPLLTYVSRGLEPVRGFPEFMHILKRLQKIYPHHHTLIVGFEQSFYSSELEEGESYKKRFLEELDLDLSRITFAGALNYHEYQQVLQASSVHVYFTKDFVPSWSLVEAMASGCCIVGSKGEAIAEFLNEENSALVNMADAESTALEIAGLFDDPARRQKLGDAARAKAEEDFSIKKRLPEYLKLILGAGLIHSRKSSP